MPVHGRGVAEAVRRRADELAPASAATVHVVGTLPELPPTVAAHCYRIAAEALTNAVRHADADVIVVLLDPDEPFVTVTDDGRGLPSAPRPGSYGLRTMHDRARTIGAHLQIRPGAHGRGTVVRLVLPTPRHQGATP